MIEKTCISVPGTDGGKSDDDHDCNSKLMWQCWC